MSDITITAVGTGQGTKVYIDGEEIKQIYDITLLIPAGEGSKICIKKLATDKDSEFIVNPAKDDVLREEFWFQGGEIRISGAVQKLAEPNS